MLDNRVWQVVKYRNEQKRQIRYLWKEIAAVVKNCGRTPFKCFGIRYGAVHRYGLKDCMCDRSLAVRLAEIFDRSELVKMWIRMTSQDKVFGERMRCTLDNRAAPDRLSQRVVPLRRLTSSTRGRAPSHASKRFVWCTAWCRLAGACHAGYVGVWSYSELEAMASTSVTEVGLPFVEQCLCLFKIYCYQPCYASREVVWVLRRKWRTLVDATSRA